MNYLVIKLVGYLLTLIVLSVSLALISVGLLDNGYLGMAITWVVLVCVVVLVWFAKIVSKTRWFSVLIPGATALLPLVDVLDVVWVGPLALVVAVVLAYLLSRRAKLQQQ